MNNNNSILNIFNIALISGWLLLLGFGHTYIYYTFFDINIVTYITSSELILIIAPILFKFGLSLFIISTIEFFNLSHKKWTIPVLLISTIIIILIYLFNFIPYTTFLTSLISIIFISAVSISSYFVKKNNMKFDLDKKLIGFMLIFTVILGIYSVSLNYHYYRQIRYNNGAEIFIGILKNTTSDSVVVSSDSLILVGDTYNYYFFKNFNNNSTEVFNKREFNSVTFKPSH